MREGIDIEVSAADRERLVAVVGDRNSPQKHVWRARIILATGEGCGTAQIMRSAGVSKPCVWRWQERFMREGVAGLVHDKTRKPGLPPLPSALVDHVVELTLAEPPGETTHWTGRAMAAASGWTCFGKVESSCDRRGTRRCSNDGLRRNLRTRRCAWC